MKKPKKIIEHRNIIDENVKANETRLNTWKIEFLGRSKHLLSDLFASALLFFLIGFILIFIIRDVTNRSEFSFFHILYLFAIIPLFLMGMAKIPFNPIILEKSDEALMMTMIRGNWGIGTLGVAITLSDIKEWSFSKKCMVLRFKVRSSLKGKGWDADIFQKIYFKGIKENDLSFILDWLSHNYKRNKKLDND
jgi:hypothetical protein